MASHRTQHERVYRTARRLLSILLTVLAAVLIGVVVWPAARKHYHAGRIDSNDPAIRARALEAVLPHAATDDALRRRLLDVLVGLAGSDDGIGPLQARVAAGWLFDNSPGFAQLAGSRLDAAPDDDAFARLARLMIIAGQWDVPTQSVARRVRWLAYRYGTTSGQERTDVVEAMAKLGHAARDGLQPLLARAVVDPSSSVRLATIDAVGVVLSERGIPMLIRSVDDADPAVRRAAILAIVAIDPDVDAARVFRRGLTDDDPGVREAAIWAIGESRPDARRDPVVHRELIHLLDEDESSQVRATAAWVVRDNDRLIDHLQHDEAVTVRARSAWSLRPPLTPAHAAILLETVASERKYWITVAAVMAAGRCASPDRRPQFRRALLERLQNALQTGEDDLAAGCIEALGRLADPSLKPLLTDLVTRCADRHWVALGAARSAARVDAAMGAELLVKALASRHDAARDLAAFELARLPQDAQARARLRDALRSQDIAQRPGAVLAAALIDRETRQPDDELMGYLRPRTDPTSRLYEDRVALRAYYLCGQYLLGDAAALGQIRTLTNAGPLPVTAACLSMLAMGDRSALDAVLLDTTAMPPGFDARSLLFDGRFGLILRHYLPAAPPLDPFFDPQLQARQQEGLRLLVRYRARGTPDRSMSSAPH